jgi:hypothetical protein
MATAVLAALTFVASSQTLPVTLRSDAPQPPLLCGTRVDEGLRGIRPRAVQVADGETLSFEQDPPLLTAHYEGAVTLRQFSVVGDVASLEFHRYNPDNPEGDLEVWPRSRSQAVGGRLISVFEPSWDARVLDGVLSRVRVGYDRPSVYWGSVSVAGLSRSVTLRLGFGGIPHSDVVAVDATAQYASNVINLVMPGFGDSRTTDGSQGFELSAVAQQTLRYVADTYDDIAVIPVAIPVADFGAFHRNVRNAVSGINIARFDNSIAYGRSTRLQGIEAYGSVAAARYEDTNHEMAHQWNSHFDWIGIAGIAGAGHQPDSH